MSQRLFIYNMNTKPYDIKWSCPWVIGDRSKAAEKVLDRFKTLPEAHDAATQFAKTGELE